MDNIDSILWLLSMIKNSTSEEKLPGNNKK